MKENYTEWAEILTAIGEDKQIQFLASAEHKWTDTPHIQVLQAMVGNAWNRERFRVKPNIIVIGAMEVPGPLRNRITHMGRVYMPNITGSQLLTTSIEFDIRNSAHVMWQKRGLLHDIESAAKTHAKALLAFTDSGEES